MADRPLVLAGFMGAGKTTVGHLVAAARGVPFADVDDAIVAEAGVDVPTIFAQEGEEAFRAREERAIARLVADGSAVIALGGGALRGTTPALLAERATVVWLDCEAEVAWERVRAEGDRRPLARDEAAFRELHGARRALYATAADCYVDASAAPQAVADAVAGAPVVRPGAIDRLGALVGDRRAALVLDQAIAGRITLADHARVVLAGGEDCKTLAGIARLWEGLAAAGLERRDVVVAAGGGTITDVAGFAAATFRRGLAWIAVPTTLVGQVDAAIGGKTGINVAAKNDVGAFHLPEAVVADPDLLTTLPPREWAAGFAEVVKTGLLAGGRLHGLCTSWPPGHGDRDARTELVRLCAAYKLRIVCEDPREAGVRAYLNLGHTIGHAVEAVAGFGGLVHGEAIAVGLSAALWLSVELRGLDPAILAETEALLVRHGLPVRAPGLDPAQVWAALAGDKKRSEGRPRLVLLDAVGSPVHGIDPGDDLLRRAVQRAAEVPSSR